MFYIGNLDSVQQMACITYGAAWLRFLEKGLTLGKRPNQLTHLGVPGAVHLIIPPTLFEQLVMAPLLHDFAVRHDVNFVRALYAGQVVRCLLYTSS